MSWPGAAGTEQMLKGLRAFMSWTHPQVTVSEAESASDLPAYEVRGMLALITCTIAASHSVLCLVSM